LSMTLVFVLPLRPRPLRGVGTCPLIHSNYFSVLIIRFCHSIKPNPNPNLTLTLTLTLTLNRPKNNSGELTDKYRVFLWSTIRKGTSFMSVPNLKPIAQFVPKLLRGPKISKSGHVTQATPT